VTGTPDAPQHEDAAVSRRTWLAAERTWLAWWRTGLGAAGLAIAVGRILPGLAGGERWPYRLLGLGYGALAVAVLVVGAIRQQHATTALRRGGYAQLSTPLVMGLTAGAVVLATVTVVMVIT
jgi:uncharacterized membrane protein YidH (DUF202 family)